MKTALGLASFCLITAIVTAGLVKRDTADDIKESLGNFGDSIQSEVDKLQNGGVMEEINKHCLQNSQCLEPFQYCNMEINKEKLTDFASITDINVFRCTFHIWVYVAAAVVVALLVLLLCASCACCPCCCLYSLCRKK